MAMLYRRTIFMTGFPGFIAVRLVEKLAQSDTQFFLLVEKRFVETAMAAVEEIAADTSTPLENFALIEGDITKSDLGIDPHDLETIIAETTDVFHLAAIYDLAVASSPAFGVNLEGTKNVNSLVKKISGLKHYNYVSTCYVAGRRKGKILESELEHDAGFRNFYEESKYLAEIEVEALKASVPTTIFRPSVVVGDSATGDTAKYDGIYYLINYLRKAPALLRLLNVGNESVKLNVVPVDFVVDAVTALAGDPASIGKTLAIADPEPLTTARMFDVIAEDLVGRRSEFKPPQKLTEWFLNTPISPFITGLPHAAVPYFYIEQEYDTAEAASLLKEHGIQCPSFPGYVTNLIDFVEEFPDL